MIISFGYVRFSYTADAMATLRSFLSPSAILVGQGIQNDVQWLQLAEGVDYHSMINIANLFRVWNPSHNSYTNFSQDHCARVWLGVKDRPNHDALTDAAISMSLFNAYRRIQWDPNMMYQYQQATLAAPRVLGFSAQTPVLDGCWYVSSLCVFLNPHLIAFQFCSVFNAAWEIVKTVSVERLLTNYLDCIKNTELDVSPLNIMNQVFG